MLCILKGAEAPENIKGVNDSSVVTPSQGCPEVKDKVYVMFGKPSLDLLEPI